MEYLKLVNKTFGIDESYIPNDLVITDNNENNFHNYVDPTLKPQVRKVVFDHFLEMKDSAFKEAGIEILIDSGYRSSKYQEEVWKYYFYKYLNMLKEKLPYEDDMIYELAKAITNKRVALPGHSEHQLGLAIDIARIKDRVYTDEMVGTFEAQWLYENATKYGFILRYPEGKEQITGYNFEPWHYRFVGTKYSPEFYNGDYLTLEEFHYGRRLKKN